MKPALVLERGATPVGLEPQRRRDLLDPARALPSDARLLALRPPRVSPGMALVALVCATQSGLLIAAFLRSVVARPTQFELLPAAVVLLALTGLVVTQLVADVREARVAKRALREARWRLGIILLPDVMIVRATETTYVEIPRRCVAEMRVVERSATLGRSSSRVLEISYRRHWRELQSCAVDADRLVGGATDALTALRAWLRCAGGERPAPRAVRAGPA